MECEKRYAEVLLPLRLKGLLSYYIPDDLMTEIAEGSWVEVSVRGRRSIGVVERISATAPVGISVEAIRPLAGIVELHPVSHEELVFWNTLADYYMCSPGEVFKAAYGIQLQKTLAKGRRRMAKEPDRTEQDKPNELSEAQSKAYESIQDAFNKDKTVLLKGVTGSGKTEIYVKLALGQLAAGRSVLYLVPEIALSKQLEERLRRVFGSDMRVFHSGQTIPNRRDTIEAVRGRATLVLGTRSSVFLPFHNLGLVIVDEEHDQSYKQDDPAPRYNGRDAALILASQRGANVLLGSATPSFESLYNVDAGKFSLVSLDVKFHDTGEATVKIIDTNEAWKHREMHGSFSQELINEMRRTLEQGRQILVFRSRRAYATHVQCSECGDIPKCPKCNISLSYHRFNNTLQCHYCGWSVPFTTRCKACGEPSLMERGAGTEKIEEEILDLFPGHTVARFDADTTSSKKEEERLINDFASGKIDIMVGTQMITKGFDFKGLSLVVLLQADSVLAVQDFRSDERTGQLITQLLGRAGRREIPGRLLIQTAQKDHPALNGATASHILYEERRTFNYPPFVRLITIRVKDKYEGRLWNVCRRLSEEFAKINGLDIVGPVSPAMDFIGGEHIKEFHIKLSRASLRSAAMKKALSAKIELVESEFRTCSVIILDVDPQ